MRLAILFFLLAYLPLMGHMDPEDFRDYENCPEHVVEFYRKNHRYQTLDFVLNKKKEYFTLDRMSLDIWEVMDLLDDLVDESDPDIDLPQSHHAFQTAEAIRQAGHPRWLILTGLIHDLGKMLAVFGEPQWAVVGDTFPVGCKFSEKIVFYPFFKENPDFEKYQTLFGIYTPNCGFRNLHLSFGHDEYLYQVLKGKLPEEALYIIRFHSFYPAHQEGAYSYFMDDYDNQMMPWVQLFQSFDLYSKENEEIDVEEILPFYKDLVQEFLPDRLKW